MTSVAFGGTGTSVTGFTDQWVHVGGVALPTSRNPMFSGPSYAYITSMGAYVAGRGSSRTIQLSFEATGAGLAVGVPAGGSAVDTGPIPCNILANGGTDTFRITGNGSFYFGRGGAGGPSTDSHGSSFSNVLGGYYTYLSAPTAPTSPSVSAVSATSILVSWAPPADNGDTPITGYRIDVSTVNTFATGTSLEVGNVNSYTVTGLASSTTYYFRILAENAATAAAGNWSAATATVSMTTSAGSGLGSATVALQAKPTATFTYPASSCGFWGFWMTQSTSSWYVDVKVASTFGGADLLFGVDPAVGFWAATSTAANPMTDGPTYRPVYGFTGEHHFSVGVGATFSGGTWKFPLTLYVDGVQVASGQSATLTPPASFTNASRQPTSVQIGTLGTVGYTTVSRLSHTLNLSQEALVAQGTEAGALSAISAATKQITLGTLPSDLSAAPIGYVDTATQSTLDVLNLIMRTEQGYLDTVTNGTLTNPVQTIRVRARQRPATVTYSFDAQHELAAPVDFVRDVTNLIWSDVVTGANSTSQTVSQASLQARAGSNNASDTVALYKSANLYEWGTDRLWRGQNVALRPVAVQINHLTTSNGTTATDRSADLLNMVPGDRIRITNIPSSVLGFTTWDGWLLDKAQTHTSGESAQDTFTLYLQPCQPATAVFDTDLFANDGNLLISTALTSVATSVVVTPTDGVTFFDLTAVPYTLQIEKEQVTVTAAAAPASGSQTLTIARAANGTTAAAHAIGVAPEVITSSIYAF